MQGLYTGNYKMPMKEIEKNLNKWSHTMFMD